LRDELKAFLEAHGIVTQIHYPCPVHLQPAYRERFQYRLPETEAAAREILSLPMSPHFMKAQHETICGSLTRWLERSR
jgi:dTDP-4-amino-4,6-dideoxygalactose transaminase